MSVTFYAAGINDATRTFRLRCDATGDMGEWTGCDNARAEAKAHALVCDHNLCVEYGADVDETTPGGVEVNLANTNARLVLDALGYATDDDLAGEDSVDGLAGRVLVALALAPVDEGVPAHRLMDGEGLFDGGVQVDCGRRPGYLQEVLVALDDLVCVARSFGLATVCWA